MMERIVLEVDEAIAREWRYSSEKRRNEVANAISKFLKTAFKKKSEDDFLDFINEVQTKAEQRGLTENVLNDILNGKD